MSFTLKGVRVNISFWFLFFISIVSFYSHNFYLTLLSLVLHEISHTLMLYIFKGKITEIDLKLTEINIKSNVMSLPRHKALLVLFIGPFSNIIAALLFKDVNTDIALINLILGVFQLLPVDSSDSDNMLQVIFNGKGRKILRMVYFIFAFIIFMLGIEVLVLSRYNYSLLSLGIFLIVKTLL